MKQGETIHLGDGAYLHFDGDGFELRANHHEHPTDKVYLDCWATKALVEAIAATKRDAAAAARAAEGVT